MELSYRLEVGTHHRKAPLADGGREKEQRGSVEAGGTQPLMRERVVEQGLGAGLRRRHEDQVGAERTQLAPTALPQRNLLRQVTWSMPSGQAIAQVLGVDRLSLSDLNELSSYGLGLEKNTPLWYYALAEAEVMEQGLHLGPVGGRIVAEVIIGLLQTDPASYLSSSPSWTPTLPTRYSTDGGFRMIDFLAFAGVDGVR